MKKCTECGKTKLQTGFAPAEIEVGSRVFSREVAAQTCGACGAIFYDGPGLVAFEQDVVRWLAENGFASGEEFKLLRKTAGLWASELADLLGVSAETVSHWENDKHPFDRSTQTTLASLVLDHLDGRSTTLARLKKIREPATRLQGRISLPAARLA